MEIRKIRRLEITLTGVLLIAVCSCLVLYVNSQHVFDIMRDFGITVFAILALYVTSMVYLDSKIRSMRSGIRHRFDGAQTAVIEAILKGKQRYAEIEKEALKTASEDGELTKTKVLTAISNLVEAGYIEPDEDRYKVSKTLLDYVRTSK